mmetsp:Transcript_72611/g.115890  ORF Transcript_72611/g.115890 Transcript_72611/m.115890 type:complete len:213 (-) Transcript_72611:1687-2325(-)
MRRLRHRDIHQIHRLQQLWTRRNLACRKHLLCARHDLARASMDGIGVQFYIRDVVANAAHYLIAEHSASGYLHEGAHHVVLDLVQKLYAFGHVHHTVGHRIRRTAKRPDLSRLANLPLVLVRHLSTKRLHIRGSDQHNITLFQALYKLLQQRLCVHIESVVFVGRFRHTDVWMLAIIASLGLHCLGERHHRLRHSDVGAFHVVLAQVFETNL